MKSEFRYFRKYDGPLRRAVYRLGIIFVWVLRMATLDLARAMTGKREMIITDVLMLKCALTHHVSKEAAQTREPIRSSRIANENRRPS